MDNIKIEYIPIKELKPYERNQRKHADYDISQIMVSIQKYGFNDPIGIWSDKNIIVEGHGRLAAAKKLHMKEVPVIRLDHLTDEQRKEYAIIHNKTAELSEWDMDLLAEDVPQLDFSDFEIDWGLPTDDEESNETDASRKLSDRFLIPPFDIFNARGGEWNERKRYWNSIIKDKAQARADASCNMSDTEKYGKAFTSDVSILDPVLSEIVCKWFAPNNCSCFDCFAGDTVFGYVSAYLGNTFTGIELRQEQADFNNNATKGLNARYICDDGRNVLNHIKEESQDLLFSCPPYFDLEVYSDNENDASNQDTYEDFYDILDTAFSNAIKALKENRFAVIVVGDIRDKKTGAYYNFPNDIINTFRKNGMILYNNIKILTPIGTAQIRAGKYMQYRKTAHVYQDVLVFYKGNPKEIKSIFKEVEVADVSADME